MRGEIGSVSRTEDCLQMVDAPISGSPRDVKPACDLRDGDAGHDQSSDGKLLGGQPESYGVHGPDRYFEKNVA